MHKTFHTLLASFVIVVLLLSFSPLQGVRATPTTTWMVNTLTDAVYGTCNASQCTLSDAVKLAQSGDTIIFDPSLSGTINIYDILYPKDNVTIHGSPRVIISGGNTKEIFRFWHITTAHLDNLTLEYGSYDVGGAIYIDTGCTVYLSNSTLKWNHASNSGGGIENYGTLYLTDSLLEGNSAISGGAIASANDSLTITRSTLKGNSVSGPGGGLNVHNGTASVIDSTFDSNSAGTFGGGIYNLYSTLTLTGSTIINNSVPQATGDKGGGIYNLQSTLTTMLTITNSTLSANSAYDGGAIFQEAGTLNLTNSTLAGNSASNLGAGILNYGTLNITNNIIANSGAGLDCDNKANLNTNTDNLVADGSCSAAFSGDPKLNALADNGGPTWSMALQSDSQAIDNGDSGACPAKDQRGVTRPQGSHCDIGAYEYGTTTPGTLNKSAPGNVSIVASGSPTLSWSASTNAAFYEYCYATTTGCTSWISAGTSTSAGLNGLYFAQLYYWQVRAVAAGGPVAADAGAYWSFTTPGLPSATASAASGITNNGATLNGTVNAHHADTAVTFEYGKTASYGSVVTAVQSPVSGASDTAVSKAITGLDFNTLYHFRVDATNSMGTTHSSDMTFNTPCYISVNVTDLGDAGAGTLRQAIYDVCTGGTITFDGSLANKTIALTSSTLEIPRSMTIDGSALNPPVTISGGNALRIFYIGSGVTAILDGLVLADGSTSNSGGAIENIGTLTVLNSILQDNAAAFYGGAIDTQGSLTVTDSTFDSNHTPRGGGAMEVSDGSSTVTGSTFSGNYTDDCGGAIEVDSATAVANSTFTGNTAECGGAIVNWDNLNVTNSTFSANTAYVPTYENQGGAGIYNDYHLNLANTIIANSTAGGDCVNDEIDGATINTNTNNLVEDGSCSAGLSGDPKLAALADNGGPTQTMALLPGSPAIDTGDDTTCAADPVNGKDQRGVTRPQGAHCDIGAFEYVDNKSIPILIFPADGADLLYNLPAFDWSDVTGAISYQIQVSKVNTFKTTLWSKTSTTSTYTPAKSLPVKSTLYWHVRAKLTATTYSGWSEVHSFTTANPPSIPVLAAPKNKALITNYKPLLDWKDSSVPTGTTFLKYQLQLSKDSSFSAPVNVDVNGLATDSKYTPDTDLDPNTTYYWRVQSYNTLDQYSSWSKVRYFRTAILPPTLNDPGNGTSTTNRRPTFDWSDPAGASSYVLQVSTSSTFKPSVVKVTVTSSTYTPVKDLPVGTLYWRVMAKGANGPSLWSDVWTLIEN